ncbi:phosphate ABC transporter substrate-binding protein [Candidatus Riflebacteria bacterium]
MNVKILIATNFLFMMVIGELLAESLKIEGSSTVRPIVQKASKVFLTENTDVEFNISGGGSSHGIESAATGDVNIGMASRDFKKTEMKKWDGLVTHKIGIDGIAVIVNRWNPIKGITKKQIQDIFTGKITNWKEFGGPDLPIKIISLEEGRSSLDLFNKFFSLESRQVGKGKHRYTTHRVIGSEHYSKAKARTIGPNRDVISNVAFYKNCIGYVSIGTAQDIFFKGGRIKLLPLDGVKASVENVSTGKYLLRHTLNLITPGPPTGKAREFIDFLTSFKGQKIVSGLGFVPIK